MLYVIISEYNLIKYVCLNPLFLFCLGCLKQVGHMHSNFGQIQCLSSIYIKVDNRQNWSIFMVSESFHFGFNVCTQTQQRWGCIQHGNKIIFNLKNEITTKPQMLIKSDIWLKMDKQYCVFKEYANELVSWIIKVNSPRNNLSSSEVTFLPLW